jgi:methylated-DNA-[protein]-cysteine S-methyltransferase
MKLEIFGEILEINSSIISEGEDEICKQIQQYLNTDRKQFNLEVVYPVSFTGKVMREISRIEYGETKSYGEIAEKLDTSPIAVGQACGRNPVPVVIPCHRVTDKNSIGGYIAGKNVKRKLLELEH